jgi:hypothetical protein
VPTSTRRSSRRRVRASSPFPFSSGSPCCRCGRRVPIRDRQGRPEPHHDCGDDTTSARNIASGSDAISERWAKIIALGLRTFDASPMAAACSPRRVPATVRPLIGPARIRRPCRTRESQDACFGLAGRAAGLRDVLSSLALSLWKGAAPRGTQTLTQGSMVAASGYRSRVGRRRRGRSSRDARNGRGAGSRAIPASLLQFAQSSTRAGSLAPIRSAPPLRFTAAPVLLRGCVR